MSKHTTKHVSHRQQSTHDKQKYTYFPFLCQIVSIIIINQQPHCSMHCAQTGGGSEEALHTQVLCYFKGSYESVETDGCYRASARSDQALWHLPRVVVSHAGGSDAWRSRQHVHEMLSCGAATVVSANTNDSYRCNNPCLEHFTCIYRRSSHPGIPPMDAALLLLRNNSPTTEWASHSANSTFIVLENTAKLKPVSKWTSFLHSCTLHWH